MKKEVRIWEAVALNRAHADALVAKIRKEAASEGDAIKIVFTDGFVCWYHEVKADPNDVPDKLLVVSPDQGQIH